MRVVQGSERSDAGAFALIERSRLIGRLAASSRFPITLLIAPAGYGKSVVLRQYLRTLRETNICFTLRGEHGTLLSFLRGLAEALRPHAAHAITALAGAYERATSQTRGIELAQWMRAHLESFHGIVAIDDLHLADADPEVASFLSSLIESTKCRIRWILATRTTPGLPIGTWLAYRDADVPIDEEDLRFTFDEIDAAPETLHIAMRHEELADLLTLTEGWTAAVSFALRTSTRSADLRNVSALTREMIYRFLAEQVYAGLHEDEKALLEVAVALPAIDVSVLESAGFDCALQIVEHLRERTAFIYEESPGVYQCHDLFREFLRYRSSLGGKRWQQAVHARAARGLERNGDIEHAIVAYTLASSAEDVVRLLECYGFDLLERARGDVVGRAVEGLDEGIRRENATVLALQGALQAVAGKFVRAESLLRRSLVRAQGNRDLVATASLRLASLIANQGGDVSELLGSVGDDELQSVSQRAEALSLIAGRQAAAGHHIAARTALKRLQPLLVEIESELVRARVLHRIGIAFHHLGMATRAFEALTQSVELSSEWHLYSVESRANAVLSNLVLHEEDDVERQLAYAESAATAATKAGDAFALQTALLQVLSAKMRLGDSVASVALEQRLTAARRDDLMNRYVTLFRSVRLAWEGRFSEAHRIIGSLWEQMPFDFDRLVAGSEFALFLAVDGERDRSGALIKEILEQLDSSKVSGLFRIRAMAITRAFLGLAEAANGRLTRAERMLKTIPDGGDFLIAAVVRTVENILLRYRHRGEGGSDCVKVGIERLVALGYAEVARLLEAVDRSLGTIPAGKSHEFGHLTRSEIDVLKLLADGLVPKEIAERSARSVYTVRVHIANAIAKLGCHGTSEAVKMAQQKRII